MKETSVAWEQLEAAVDRKLRADAADAARAHRILQSVSAQFAASRPVAGSPGERILRALDITPACCSRVRWCDRSRTLIVPISPLSSPKGIRGLFKFGSPDGPSDRNEIEAPPHWQRDGTRGCAAILTNWGRPEEIVVASRVVTALVAGRLTGLPPCAALTPLRLSQLEVPRQIRRVSIAYEIDDADVEAAMALATRLTMFGVVVNLMPPPPTGFRSWHAWRPRQGSAAHA